MSPQTVTCVAACAGLWHGAAAEPGPGPEPGPEPGPDPLLLYTTFPSWAAEMFGTPQEVAQAAASAMTQRTQVSSPSEVVFRPAGLAPSPLIAIRDAQAPPQQVAALRHPSTLNVQLLQRPVTFLQYPFAPMFLPAMHLRVPYPTLPYDTRYRPPSLFYPSYTYAHSRPTHLDDDDDDDDDEVDMRPTYVRVAHFPQQLPTFLSLRAGGEDDGPLAPAGIAQALQPTFSVVPFSNAKAHPSLRDVQPSTDGAVEAV